VATATRVGGGDRHKTRHDSLLKRLAEFTELRPHTPFHEQDADPQMKECVLRHQRLSCRSKLETFALLIGAIASLCAIIQFAVWLAPNL